MSEEILKVYKTESSVPTEPEVDLDFRGHRNMLAQKEFNNGFLDFENINSEEISKIYKTQSSVPSSTSCTGS